MLAGGQRCRQNVGACRPADGEGGLDAVVLRYVELQVGARDVEADHPVRRPAQLRGL